jgi:ABC-type glycerol-3-phosphate transport system substrate-binding protein
MKKTKKIVSVVLTLVLVLTMLGGCSKGNKASDSSASTTGAAKSNQSSSKEDSSPISVMGIDWGYGPKQNSSMEQYWEKYLGVKLDVQWVSYTDYAEKLNTLLSSGKSDDIPDVIQIMKTDNSFYYPVFAQACDAGVFVKLDKYLFDNGFVKNNKIMSTWPDTVWSKTKYNGGTYILPRSTAEVAPTSGIEVRKDLMEKYGYTTEPTTMNELKDWLIGLSKKSGLYALDFSTSDLDDNRVKAFAEAFTGMQDWGIDANGNYIYYAFADGYVDFLNWMKDLYDAKAIDQEFILNQADNSSWKAGKSVAYLSTWYNWNQSKTNASVFNDNVKDATAWCLMPVKGPKQYTVNVDDYGFGEAIAINSKCSDAKIKKIMEAFNHTEDDYLDVMKYGVKGLHYDLDADGNRIQSDAQKTACQEGYVGAWNQIFLKSNADQLTDKFVNKGCTDEYIDRATKLKEFTEKVASESDLTTKNLNLISSTYNSSWSTLTADLDDMRAKYIMGEISLKDWNSYVDGIVNSSEYKAIISEYKDAAAKNK